MHEDDLTRGRVPPNSMGNIAFGQDSTGARINHWPNGKRAHKDGNIKRNGIDFLQNKTITSVLLLLIKNKWKTTLHTKNNIHYLYRKLREYRKIIKQKIQIIHSPITQR